MYYNLEYFFWRQNDIKDPELDKDPYPWIIWYLWIARNDKIFRGITRDPLELIKHAQSECNAWFDANSKISEKTEAIHQTRIIQV